jgi:hypothetical protein
MALNFNAVPVRVVANLAPYAVRPEGVNVITLNLKRAIDGRKKAQKAQKSRAFHCRTIRPYCVRDADILLDRRHPKV